MKSRENQLLYWFHPSFSFSTEWTHFFSTSTIPASSSRHVICEQTWRVQKYVQILSTIWTRAQEANIWHRLYEHEDGELGREKRTRANEVTGNRRRSPSRFFYSVFPSTSSTVTCKLQRSHLKSLFCMCYDLLFQPTHSRVLTISFLHAASPWGGWRGGHSPACAWNTGSPLLVAPSTCFKTDYFNSDFPKKIISVFTSIRGFGLTAGCTSPENRKGINFHQ